MTRLATLVLSVLLLVACAAPAGPTGATQRAPQPSGAEAAAEAAREREAKVQEHLANARDYRANDQHGLALNEVTQALAVQPNHADAQELQRQVRAEATAQVQQIQQAQATAAAQEARAQATAEARAEATSQAQAARTATAAARSAPAAPARAAPAPRSCCRVCTTGKACGDSCIARNLNCRVGVGCACDASLPGTPQPLARLEHDLRGLLASALPIVKQDQELCEETDDLLVVTLFG